MSKRVINIKNNGEDNFVRVENKPKGSGCPEYPFLQKQIDWVNGVLDRIAEQRPTQEKRKTIPTNVPDTDGKTSANNSKASTKNGVTLISKPTSPTPAKMHKCPSFVDVLHKLKSLILKLDKKSQKYGQGIPITERSFTKKPIKEAPFTQKPTKRQE